MYKHIGIVVGYLMTMQSLVVGQVTASHLLDRYEAAQANIRAFGANSVDTGKITWPDRTAFSRTESVFLYDGDRVHLRLNQWPRLSSKDEPAPMENADDRSFLWDRNSFFEHRKQKGFDGKLFIHGDDKLKKGMISMGYGGAPLMGIFYSDLDSVSSILRQADTISVRPEQEQVGKSFCHVIDATTNQGRYTVWIDPNHGYNIAKAEVQKEEGDIAYGKPLGRKEDLRGMVVRREPKVLSGVSFSLKNVRFDKIEGKWVPMEADWYLTDDRGGDMTVVEMHHKRTYLELNPDFDAKAFVPDIPDGTRTFIISVPGIAYKWEDGKPVPDVDEGYVSDLDSEIAAVGADTKVFSEAPAEQKAEPGNQEAETSGPNSVVATNTQKLQEPLASGTNSSAFLKWVVVSLVFIGIIGCLLFFRLRVKQR